MINCNIKKMGEILKSERSNDNAVSVILTCNQCTIVLKYTIPNEIDQMNRFIFLKMVNAIAIEPNFLIS
jgi:hypothetical protein